MQGKEKLEAIQTQRLFKHGHLANLTFRFELYQKLLRNFPICLYNQEVFFSQILFHFDLKCRRRVLALTLGCFLLVSAFFRQVLEVVAGSRGEDVQSLAETVYENTMNLFFRQQDLGYFRGLKKISREQRT